MPEESHSQDPMLPTLPSTSPHMPHQSSNFPSNESLYSTHLNNEALHSTNIAAINTSNLGSNPPSGQLTLPEKPKLKKRKISETAEAERYAGKSWTEHTKASSWTWRHFQRSADRSETSNRYFAKCNYCDWKCVGKPSLMAKHLLHVCDNVESSLRAQFFVLESQSVEKNKLKKAKLKDRSIDSSQNGSKSKKSEAFSSKMELPPTKQLLKSIVVSKNEDLRYCENLVKSFIVHGMAFASIREYHLVQFIHGLKPNWTFPTVNELIDIHLPRLFKKLITKRDKTLSNMECITLALDGWRDVYWNHMYTLSALTPGKGYEPLHVFDFSRFQGLDVDPTSLVSEMSTTLHSLQKENKVQVNSFKAFLFSVRSRMDTVHLTDTIEKIHPGIVPIPCGLSMLLGVVEDICASATAMNILEVDCKLLEYLVVFRSAEFEKRRLKYESRKQIPTEFAIFGLRKKEWFSFTALCVSILYYQDMFKEIHECTSQAVKEKYPVSNLITEENFEKNEQLWTVLSPLHDLILSFSKTDTGLLDVISHFLRLHSKMKLIKETTESEFAEIGMKSIAKHFNTYLNNGIYIVALCLCPKYKDFCLSGKYNEEEIGSLIQSYAAKWGFSYEARDALKSTFEVYVSKKFSFTTRKMSPKIYWAQTSTFGKTMKKFATYIFQIKGQSSPEVNYFAELAYKTPVIKGKLIPDIMKTIGMCKAMLLKSVPESGSSYLKRKRGRFTPLNLFDTTSIYAEDNSEFVNYKVKLEELKERKKNVRFNTSISYIDNLFDLKRMDLDEGHSNELKKTQEVHPVPEVDHTSFFTEELLDSF
eukprot:snap_masked-scaffold_27-processed-gene-1.49-mRNA-1 protein AED:1.00 eAED:1.00 QI:0/-1/0/0/-1/1/1/0/814